MLRPSLLRRRTGERLTEEGRTDLRGEGVPEEGGASMKAVVVCREPARVSRSRALGVRE